MDDVKPVLWTCEINQAKVHPVDRSLHCRSCLHIILSKQQARAAACQPRCEHSITLRSPIQRRPIHIDITIDIGRVGSLLQCLS
jgi:hypothetical protein